MASDSKCYQIVFWGKRELFSNTRGLAEKLHALFGEQAMLTSHGPSWQFIAVKHWFHVGLLFWKLYRHSTTHDVHCMFANLGGINQSKTPGLALQVLHEGQVTWAKICKGWHWNWHWCELMDEIRRCTKVTFTCTIYTDGVLCVCVYNSNLCFHVQETVEHMFSHAHIHRCTHTHNYASVITSVSRHAHTHTHHLHTLGAKLSLCGFPTAMISQEPKWEFFGYNPPFTPPCFRTNEVAIYLTQVPPNLS